ncbi:hypothetical protein FQR65_LT00687 [Abscondita terminalis]|nr:hypothetical protein FQR65_LT00687 [Abscondita terminalis]
MGSPNWVSKELFERALKSYFQTNVTLLGYTSSAAVQAGDNYTSQIFRTVVTYTLENNQSKNSISLIVKCAPVDKAEMLEFIKQIKMFEKEKEVYAKTLPAIYDILGESYTLSAKFIYYTDIPNEVIIFEDLSKLGYKMHNRLQGLDLEHCLLIVEKLASLHATSLVLYDTNPELFVNFNHGLFAVNDVIHHWTQKSLEALIEACSSWNGLEKYANKLRGLADKLLERAASMSVRKRGGFNVLNHGDAWVNNFLFSYNDDGKLLDCKFVDYQVVVFASPAIDLHYFWATSPKIEVRREHLDTVLDRYYSKLLFTLSKLNYSLERIPTKNQFVKDWNSKAFYGFIAAVAILPLVKASSRDDASFDDFMASEGVDSFRHHAFNNERYRKHMEYLLPFLDNLGALDSY